jgi:hypothetical protein
MIYIIYRCIFKHIVHIIETVFLYCPTDDDVSNGASFSDLSEGAVLLEIVTNSRGQAFWSAASSLSLH